MSEAQDVTWLITPLAVYYEAGITSWWGKMHQNQTEHYRFLTWAHHWAIQVGDQCYELHATEENRFGLDMKGVEKMFAKPLKKIPQAIQKVTAKIDLRIVPAKEWRDFWKNQDPPIHVDEVKIGQTFLNRDLLAEEAMTLWKIYGQNNYDLLVRNCQNFAHAFWNVIRPTPGQSAASKIDESSWRAMDPPVNSILTRTSASNVKSLFAIGTMELFYSAIGIIAEVGGLEALVMAESSLAAAGLGIDTLVVGGATTAEVAGGGADVVHVGSAVNAASSGNAVAGGSATVAEGGTAANAGQAATASTSHGVVGTTSAKGGIGAHGLAAKAGAIGHTAMHGATAAKLAALGKVGVAAACLHPVTGTAIVAGVACHAIFAYHKNREDSYVERRKQTIKRLLERIQGRDRENGGRCSEYIQKTRDMMDKVGDAVSRFDLEDLMYGSMHLPNVELEVDEAKELVEILQPVDDTVQPGETSETSGKQE